MTQRKDEKIRRAYAGLCDSCHRTKAMWSLPGRINPGVRIRLCNDCYNDRIFIQPYIKGEEANQDLTGVKKT